MEDVGRIHESAAVAAGRRHAYGTVAVTGRVAEERTLHSVVGGARARNRVR